MVRVGPSWRIGKTAAAYILVYALLFLCVWLGVYYAQESFGIFFGANSFPFFLLIIAGFIIGFDLTSSLRRQLSFKELYKLALISAASTFLFLVIFREAVGGSFILVLIEQYWEHRGLVGQDFPFQDIGRQILSASPLLQSPLGFVIRLIAGSFLLLISGVAGEFSDLIGWALFFVLHYLGIALCVGLGLALGQKIAFGRLKIKE